MFKEFVLFFMHNFEFWDLELTIRQNLLELYLLESLGIL